MKELVISAKENETLDYVVPSIKKGTRICVNLSKGSHLNFSVFAKENISDCEILVNQSEYSEFEGYFADFSEGNEKIIVNISLNGEQANCHWHLASLSSKNDKKEFEVSVTHFAKNSYAKMDNFGVCKDDAKLVFSGTSLIQKGSSGSKTHQNAKIMVFDKLSNAVAKPVLKIDENDIEASHAAVVGKINDEHLFYLTSRGIPEQIAKELITYGYLKPILFGFKDDNIKQDITSIIEGRM